MSNVVQFPGSDALQYDEYEEYEEVDNGPLVIRVRVEAPQVEPEPDHGGNAAAAVGFLICGAMLGYVLMTVLLS